MAKVKLITAGKLDAQGWKSIGKSFLLTIASAAIAFIADLTNVVDFGGYQNLAVLIIPFVVNFLRKLMGTYESTA